MKTERGWVPASLEAAQAMRRFGSRVTVLQRGPQLLSHEDEDVAAAIAGILREDGVEIVLEARILNVERLDAGTFAVGEVTGGPQFGHASSPAGRERSGSRGR